MYLLIFLHINHSIHTLKITSKPQIRMHKTAKEQFIAVSLKCSILVKTSNIKY